jgi:hypothetical protein
MSSEKEYMAADLRGPLNTWVSTATSMMATGASPPGGAALTVRDQPLPACQIVALVVASGVSQQFDLQATGFFGSTAYLGRFIRAVPESCGDTWYAWASATGTSIDKNATGGATGVAAFIPSKTYSDELPAGRYLLLQPTNAGVFRLWITNRVL